MHIYQSTSEVSYAYSLQSVREVTTSTAEYTHKHMYNLTLEKPVFCYSQKDRMGQL